MKTELVLNWNKPAVSGRILPKLYEKTHKRGIPSLNENGGMPYFCMYFYTCCPKNMYNLRGRGNSKRKKLKLMRKRC